MSEIPNLVLKTENFIAIVNTSNNKTFRRGKLNEYERITAQHYINYMHFTFDGLETAETFSTALQQYQMLLRCQLSIWRDKEMTCIWSS